MTTRFVLRHLAPSHREIWLSLAIAAIVAIVPL